MEEQSISNVIVALFQPRFKICWNITSKHPKWRFEGIFPSACPYENFCKELLRLYTPPNLFGPWPFLLGRALGSSCSVAVVWLFSAVYFQMSFQTTFLRKCIVTLVAFVCSFLQWTFSNVSSNDLPERMHICIGCICYAFLHYEFSNVSSNGSSERTHSHTDCICYTFLHSGLSYVSSNCMYRGMLRIKWQII